MINSNALETARGKLIVALDFPTIAEAKALVEMLGDEAVFYKVGLGLQLSGGDQFARELKTAGKRVFLDYKYYDISQTVRSAVTRAAEIGIDFLTVHGVKSILEAAVEGSKGSDLKVLCVTVLTSMDAYDLQEMGMSDITDDSVKDLVLHRAKRALALGVHGCIASAKEVEAIKADVSDKLMVVTPGIRAAGDSHDDQKRVATPGAAIKAGADYLVVGRAITGDPDPKAKAAAIIEEMAAAL